MNEKGGHTAKKQKAVPHKRESRTKAVFSYPLQTKVNAAFLAGQGKTPSQIAAATGITTSHRVRELLRRLEIYPAPEMKGCEAVVVLLQHGTVEAMAALADRAGMDPPSFAAHVITTMVIGEPTVLCNLLQEAES